MSTQISKSAKQLALQHGIDIATVEGTGVGGRITKSDVERAIDIKETIEEASAQAEMAATFHEGLDEDISTLDGLASMDRSFIEEAQEIVEEAIAEADQMEKEEKTETIFVSDIIERERVVGERSAMILLSRRSGLPVLSRAVCLDKDPIELVDSVVPMIAIRGKRQKKDDSFTRNMFNPVFPDEIFESLTGKVEEDQAEYFMRLGMFSYDGLATDRLRFSRFADEEFGRRDSERAARHVALSILSNPDITSGVYRLRCDHKVHIVGQAKSSLEIAEAAHKMMYRPRDISKLLGVPTLTNLAMERYDGNEGVQGQRCWEIANLFERGDEDMTGRSAFTPFVIRGLYTQTDITNIIHRGGSEGGEEVAELFKQLTSNGEISPISIAAGNVREFTLGKLAAGCQIRSSIPQRDIRGLLQRADKMFYSKASQREMEEAGVQACRHILNLTAGHLDTVLAPVLIAQSIAKVSRITGMNITEQDLVRYAIRSDKGKKVQDGTFNMFHAQQIVKGFVTPNSTEKGEAIRQIAENAYLWHKEAVQDVASAASGLKAMYTNRCPEGRIDMYVCKMDVNSLHENISRLGVRPSFFALTGHPIQVIDRSWDSYVPTRISQYFE